MKIIYATQIIKILHNDIIEIFVGHVDFNLDFLFLKYQIEHNYGKNVKLLVYCYFYPFH
jgi:hypothetical protein